MADSVKRKKELSVANKQSLTPQEITLGRELELTRQNAKSEAEPSLMTEFYREFAKLPEGAITWLFREHRRRSPYFPAISEIHGLICEWRISQRNVLEESAERQAKADLKEAREKGELVEFADIVRGLNEAVKRMPEPAHVHKLRKARVKPAMIPAITLTAEEIADRREQELAEIRKAEKA